MRSSLQPERAPGLYDPVPERPANRRLHAVAPPGSAPDRLRVAMVVASPFPANHGTPGSIREMSEAIAAEGHDLHVVAYHFGEGSAARGVHVHRVPDWGFRKTIVVGPTWEKPLLDLLMVATLVRVIRRERIDLIHAHNYEGALIGFVAKLLTGRPLIYNAINTMSDELPSYGFLRPKALAVWLARALDWIVPRLPDRTIAISEDLAGFLRARGVADDRLAVIPLGIDTTRFAAADGSSTRKRLHAEDVPVVMYTGILDRMQRIDYLLKAMTVVVAAIPRARLIIVANTLRQTQLGEVQAEVDRLALHDHVQVLESVDFEEIPDYLAAADVAVLSRPHCPGFPVKLLNYMAAAKPVVLFAGSAKGLEHMNTAVVVPDHDWQALGEGIRAVLADPALAERLGTNGRRWVAERYSLDALVTRTVALYRELQATPAPAGS